MCVFKRFDPFGPEIESIDQKQNRVRVGVACKDLGNDAICIVRNETVDQISSSGGISLVADLGRDGTEAVFEGIYIRLVQGEGLVDKHTVGDRYVQIWGRNLQGIGGLAKIRKFAVIFDRASRHGIVNLWCVDCTSTRADHEEGLPERSGGERTRCPIVHKHFGEECRREGTRTGRTELFRITTSCGGRNEQQIYGKMRRCEEEIRCNCHDRERNNVTHVQQQQQQQQNARTDDLREDRFD